jgi:hypothetical protein
MGKAKPLIGNDGVSSSILLGGTTFSSATPAQSISAYPWVGAWRLPERLER